MSRVSYFYRIDGIAFFRGRRPVAYHFCPDRRGHFSGARRLFFTFPYSTIGAERELLQMMAYEPALLIAALGMYWVTKSFHVSAIVSYSHPLIAVLPGIFISVLFILTIKLRKSPFDLSTSHHAHQELVKA